MKLLSYFQSNNKDLTLLQNSWASAINPLLKNPIVNGIALPNIELINGTNIINHRLGRKLQGWLITSIDAAATIYDAQKINQHPEQTLVLISNANCEVNIYAY